MPSHKVSLIISSINCHLSTSLIVFSHSLIMISHDVSSVNTKDISCSNSHCSSRHIGREFLICAMTEKRSCIRNIQILPILQCASYVSAFPKYSISSIRSNYSKMTSRQFSLIVFNLIEQGCFNSIGGHYLPS